MRGKKLYIILLSMVMFSFGCGLARPELATVIVTQVVRETQIVTSEVTHVVRETQIVTAEVTRIVKETVVVMPTPPSIPANTLTQGIRLQVPRTRHTATLLLDGRVLLVGGSKSPDEHLAEVELFDPSTGKTTLVSPLHTPRHGHTATLLLDGRVLVVGGYNLSQQWLSDAELYDPSADTWMVLPPIYPHGVSHTATLMKDGRVLVVGGAIGSGVITDRVEIFDPQTNSWSEAEPLASDRGSHTTQLLDDGRVLLAGGVGATTIPPGGGALLYDPQTNNWTDTGPMVEPRTFGESVRLPDGKVLVVGGISMEENFTEGPNRKMSDSAEIYDPALNTWAPIAPLSQARFGHVLVLLADGRVLVSGGSRDWDCCWNDNSVVREIEVYDPAADIWYTVGTLPKPGIFSTATWLPDGHVWVTGGNAGNFGDAYWANTWVIAP